MVMSECQWIADNAALIFAWVLSVHWFSFFYFFKEIQPKKKLLKEVIKSIKILVTFMSWSIFNFQNL